MAYPHLGGKRPVAHQVGKTTRRDHRSRAAVPAITLKTHRLLGQSTSSITLQTQRRLYAASMIVTEGLFE